MEIPLTQQQPDQYQSDPEGQILRNVVVTPNGIRLRPGAKLFLDTGEAAKVCGLTDWYSQGLILIVVNGKVFSIADPIAGTGLSYLLLEDGGRLILEDGQGALLLDTIPVPIDVTSDAFSTTQPTVFANYGEIMFFADGGVLKELHPAAINVTHSATNYRCIKNNVNITPPNATYWTTAGAVAGNAWNSYTRYGSGFADETDDSWPSNISFIGISSGYLIALEDGTQTIHYSVVDEPWNYDADFVIANQAPDDGTALKIYANDIYVAGRRSIQMYVNDGSTPWVPSSYGDISTGCIARYSFIQIDGTFLFIDTQRRLVSLQTGGREPQVLSESLNTFLKTIPDVQDAESDEVTIDGITYYICRFITAEKSFMLNINSKTWTEVDYNDAGLYRALNQIQATYVPRWDMVIAGTEDGSILMLDSNYGNDNTVAMTGYIRSPRIHTPVRVIARNLIISLTKVATVISAGSASFTVRWRDDGGEWSTAVTITMDDRTKTDFVKTINRLGSYRQPRQYEFSVDNLWPYAIQRVEQV